MVVHNYLLSLLAIIAQCIAKENVWDQSSFKLLKFQHKAMPLSDVQIETLNQIENITQLNEVLDNICVVRIVGTPEHTKVKNYIKRKMKDLNWTVESDVFLAPTPIFGDLQFENIIAKLNPDAERYLTLACHYDSKYTRERNFVGATDSAVPCAQMINLATVMNDYLQSIKLRSVSLMLLFFDGEEAFKEWGPDDSIYGAKHLAQKMELNYNTYEQEHSISDLDKMDMLLLLDLIGASDPTFYNYFSETTDWYMFLVAIEKKLASMRKFERYSYEKPGQMYFQPYSINSNVEDDHLPFMSKGVPILHLIPRPFPSFWHKVADNCSNIDISAIKNINKILRIFVTSYLHINI
uniref:Glutaminyl-peptide cyclotransferase n=1 Tax=Ampulex compressa TaxID=860918 RepID=A0A1W6EWB7_AMPCP|nr:glutaminyl-peptide cyclotransferase [Ampulex compressa]